MALALRREIFALSMAMLARRFLSWRDPPYLSLTDPPALPDRLWSKAEADKLPNRALKTFSPMTGAADYFSHLQYPSSPDLSWPAQIHNDWLETRITVSWAGSALIALVFATTLLRWFLPGCIPGGRRFVVLTWLALVSCLIHARHVFPFQVQSILLLFLVLCAILSGLMRGVALQKC